MKHATSLAFIATMIAASAALCGSAGGAATSRTAATASVPHISIAYANGSDAGPVFVQLQQGIKAAAKKAGISVTFYNNNNDGATTLSNAQLIAESHPTVAMDLITPAGVGTAVGRVFNRAHVPCIAVNVPIPGCAWFNLSNKLIGVDAAKVIGPIAKARGWTGANTTVILGQNASAGTEVNDCVRYFYTTLQNLLPDMSKIAPSALGPKTTTIGTTGVQVDGQSQIEPAYTAVKTVLETIPASRHLILFTTGDDSTMGAWRAIVQAGRAKDTLVGSLPGSTNAFDELRTNPSWVAEGNVFLPYWGEYLVAMAVTMSEGAKPPARTESPQGILTKQNMNTFFKPGTFTVRTLPPLQPLVDGVGNTYLAKSGVLQLFKNVQGVH